MFDGIGTQTIGSLALDPNMHRPCGRDRRAGQSASITSAWACSARPTARTVSRAQRSGGSNADLAMDGGGGAPATPPGPRRRLRLLHRRRSARGSTGRRTARDLDQGAQRHGVDDIIFDPISANIVLFAVETAALQVDRLRSSWTPLSNGIPTGFSTQRVRLAMAQLEPQRPLRTINRSSGGTGIYRTPTARFWALRHHNAATARLVQLALAVQPRQQDTVLSERSPLPFDNGGTTLRRITSGWGSGQEQPRTPTWCATAVQ